jgi:hypothetical protein
MSSISLRRTLVALTLLALVGLPSLAGATPLDTGMSIDPDGLLATATSGGGAQVSYDAGMLIDPNG